MDNSHDLTMASAGEDAAPEGSWSFLPYEEGESAPRRELEVSRAVRFLLIPLVDVITLSIAVTAAYLWARAWLEGGFLNRFLGAGAGDIHPPELLAGFMTIFLWLLVFHYFGVYKREIRRLSVSTFDEMPQILGAAAVGAWLMFSVLILFDPGNTTGRAIWLYVALAWLLLMVLLPLGRATLRVGLSFHNPFRTSTLVVGAGEVGRSLIGRLARHKEYGLKVVGFLDAESPVEEGEDGAEASVQLLGRPSRLKDIVDKYGISRVLIAFSRSPHVPVLEMIHQCQEMKVDVSVVPRFFEALSSRAEIEDIEGLAIMSLPRYARHGLVMRTAKRLIDLLGAAVITLILSPVLLLTAALIKLDSPGPVFFRQARMGKGHKHFMVYKFRSMYTGADGEQDDLAMLNEATGPIFKMKRDPRITRVGRVIRRLSIDELPQLFNVLKGEMSLVGPRPLPVREAEACAGTADMRHQVQPGITGLWQILGRSDIPYEEMVQLDYLYVTNWSLRWDVKILFRTLIAILRKRGAY